VILFQDFDGVLHAIGGGKGPFTHVHLLWKLLRARPEIEVVFSTSWRETYPQDVLVGFCTANGGEDLAHRFVGQTPRQRSEAGSYVAGPKHVRHAEIALWLCEHGEGRPWVALDDDPIVFPPGCENLVLVDPLKGLQQQDVDEVLRRLSLQESAAYENDPLMQKKRAYQAASRELVHSGTCKQTDLFWFSKEKAQHAVVTFPDIESWDDETATPQVGIFFDTEFTSLDENWRELISIGLVAEDSDDALYIELSDGWAKSSCSDFSRDIVLPLLGRHQPELLTRAAAAARIEEWLRARRQDPESLLLFLSDSDIDWSLMLALFEPGWARAQNAVWRHIGQELHDSNTNPEYEAALEAYFQKRAQRLLKRGGERHHALVDAKAMKAAFQKVAGKAVD
jgi:hypothetical protein